MIFKNLFPTPLRRSCINLHVIRIDSRLVHGSEKTYVWMTTLSILILPSTGWYVAYLLNLFKLEWYRDIEIQFSVLKIFYLILLFRFFCHHKIIIQNVHEYYNTKFQNGKISSVASVCIGDELMKRNLCRDQKILILRARIIFLIFSTKVLSEFRSSSYPDECQWCPSHELSWIVRVQITVPYTRSFR